MFCPIWQVVYFCGKVFCRGAAFRGCLSAFNCTLFTPHFSLFTFHCPPWGFVPSPQPWKKAKAERGGLGGEAPHISSEGGGRDTIKAHPAPAYPAFGRSLYRTAAAPRPPTPSLGTASPNPSWGGLPRGLRPQTPRRGYNPLQPPSLFTFHFSLFTPPPWGGMYVLPPNNNTKRHSSCRRNDTSLRYEGIYFSRETVFTGEEK